MGKKVLIADDEPNIVISLEFLMKREGFQVSIARDGEEALRKVEENMPDLMLLDVMMPKKSGYEVCQQVRANPACAAIKIVMLTAKGRDTEMAKGLDLGRRCLHDQTVLDQGTGRTGQGIVGHRMRRSRSICVVHGAAAE